MRYSSRRITTALVAMLFVGGFATKTEAAETSRANAPAWITTPFGIIYKTHDRETVSYAAKYAPGTIVVNTSERYLYFVLGQGQALRYNIGVGKEGYSWAGVSTISSKREWPDWSPTPNIKKRQPDLPDHMKGGDGNPLGARALIWAQRSIESTGQTSPGKLATRCRRDASA